MNIKDKYKRVIDALDTIACGYEHTNRSSMVKIACEALCDVGEWRKAQPGEFVRHRKTFGTVKESLTVESKQTLGSVLKNATQAKSKWPKWAAIEKERG